MLYLAKLKSKLLLKLREVSKSVYRIRWVSASLELTAVELEDQELELARIKDLGRGRTQLTAG